ncbi:MAG: hypothetical protein ABIY70_09500 [Capsulimonas sp.]|uniref:hypothetical protein n=1 Tax=Capsulimonas sp. TaxID=2494211 RepID=UPI00326585CD
MKSNSTIVVMNKNNRSLRAQRGQTIVIALLVLLLLAFVGGLFVTIVANNVHNGNTAGVVQTADDYAQSGIRFAHDQLMNSVDGADWRPPVTPVASVSPNDPDGDYLKAGYARYDTGNGRFLVRLTYDPLGIYNNYKNPNGAAGDPTASDPLARYIRIESVGRDGHVSSSDPTTFRRGRSGKSIAKLVGYVAIGITDYGRFITDIDRRSEVASIGVPSLYDAINKLTTPGVLDFDGAPNKLKPYPIVTTMGAPDAYLAMTTGGGVNFYAPNPNVGSAPPSGVTAVPGGGSFFSNVPVRFFGENDFYLNRPASPGAVTVADGVNIFGDLILDHYDPASASTAGYLGQQPSQMVLNPTTGSGTTYVEPSSSPNGFNTFAGAVRDGNAGSAGNDQYGYPRYIKRLEPPKLDNVDPVTNLSRYRSMAINSAPRGTATGTAGSNGYGQVVYINNTADIQNESSKLTSGYTLVDEWLNRNPGAATTYANQGKWVGDIYVPPGVEITFGLLPRAAAFSPNVYGVTLVRNDVDKGGVPIKWPNPDGTPGSSNILYIPFTDFAHGTAANPNWDVVIVAEGNVRIHGIVSADPNGTGSPTADDKAARHVTIVTNATAYIDGSLLKGNPQSTIAVLARDYVCVNTTQFTAGTEVTNPRNDLSVPVTFVPAHSYTNQQELINLGPDNNINSYLVQEFSFAFPGSTPAIKYGANNLALYFGGQTNGTDAETATVKFALMNPRTASSFGVPTANPDPTDDAAAFWTRTFTNVLHTTQPIGGLQELGASGANLNALLQDQPLQLWTGQTTADITGSKADVQLDRVAILPMDVRIEAVLYAQNKSFFVIPGQSFNTDTADTVSKYSKQNNYVTDSAGTLKYLTRGAALNNSELDQQRYPFAGQPIDLKITISGAVSEARPADISAQNAWMQKWGWIPQYHGSKIGGAPAAADTAIAAEAAGHVGASGPATGLSIIYDPQCAFPYYNNAGTWTPFRYDTNFRPLPFTPRLPVCESMLYVGQAPDDRP